MTKEQKDGFSIHDKRFWVEDEDRDEERDADQAPTAAPPPPAIDPEVLRSALAELEDTKRRVRRDADKQIDVMRGQVLESLLPVLDNLERSMAAAAAGGSVADLLNGIRLVHGQFLGALAPFGLSRRSSLGERFDPRVHDAVAVVPVADSRQDGVVVSELEPAYVIGDRVVRPAKVQVGRAAERPLS